MVKKGAWVMIESVVLEAGERPDNLPEDTKKTDLRKWVKGTLVKRAEIGGPATVETSTGRKESGTLIEVNPSFLVNYGSYVPELRKAGEQARELLRGLLIENKDGGDES